ncbi:MAG: PP2C family protein-serine/threonine phosphatase [Candidatus Rifleibacteriota bacterium]
MKNNNGPKTLKAFSFDSAVHWLVTIFCLFIFPLFIFYVSLDRLYEIKIENLRKNAHRKLSRRVEILNNYSSNRAYFHFIFKNIFELAQQQPEPEKFLALNLVNLKKRYPGCFEFIVWDAQGKTIENLTDETRYKFVIRRLFKVLKQVTQHFASSAGQPVDELQIVKENRNLVATFLGRYFIARFLTVPYYDGENAGPVKVDFSLKHSDYWYQIGDKISFLVFFNNRILETSSGLNKVVESLNNYPEKIVSGYVSAKDVSKVSVPVGSKLKADLVLALARFEKFSQSVIETSRSIVAIKVADNNLRVFSLFPKDPKLWSANDRTFKKLVQILVLVFLVYLAVYFIVFVMHAFVSIRLKLLMVFLFAGLIPLLVLGLIGFDYLQTRESVLRSEYIDHSLQRLKNFDVRSESIKHEFGRKLLKTCSRMNFNYRSGDFSEKSFAGLKDVIKECNPSEAYLISSDSRKIFEYYADNKQPSYSTSFIIPMITASLKFINGQYVKLDSQDYYNNLLSPENSDFIRFARRNSGRINEINTGNRFKTNFQFVFGIPGYSRYNYFLIILWDHKNLAEQYLDREFTNFDRKKSKLFIMSQNGSASWPDHSKIPKNVKKFLEKAGRSNGSISGDLVLDNENFLAVGIKSRYLEEMLMGTLVPVKIFAQDLYSLKLYLSLVSVLVLLLIVAISWLLSHQFMKPLRSLATATLAIGKRDFSYRIEVDDNDEIGYLATIFNRVTEGLGDLEVARIVQENLFPGNNFSAGDIEIYGRSIVMTTLGGDYYDCFPIDENHWAVIIGDVAGHGVPAGLMMAMAKAGVLTSSEAEKFNPSALVSALHKIFFAIKNPNMKRMMTFQYFLLEKESGKFTFVNAGHCFPVIVDPKKKSATFIEHVSTPLGIGRRCRYKNYSFELEPGQALVLYTDGIAEARNSSGEEFGFERFKNRLPLLYSNDPEVFYQKILSMYKEWAEEAEDDLTIIVAVRGEK